MFTGARWACSTAVNDAVGLLCNPGSRRLTRWTARRGRLGRLAADEESDLHPPSTPPETQGNA